MPKRCRPKDKEIRKFIKIGEERRIRKAKNNGKRAGSLQDNKFKK